MPTSKIQSETFALEAVAALLGVGRTNVYEQARTGVVAGVPVIRMGRRILVPRRTFERVLEYGIDEPADSAESSVEPPRDTHGATPEVPIFVNDLRNMVDTRTGAISCESPTVVTGQDCS